MHDFFLIKLFCIIWLYAEVHFRIPGLFSRYFIREPEILADVPHRIDPGKELPVMILIKDANQYPVAMNSVKVTFDNKINQVTSILKPENPELIKTKFWHKLLMVEIPQKFTGQIEVDVRIEYSINKKQKAAKNDNYKLTDKKPFQVYLDSEELPREEKWYFGDLHVHTSLTEDQVEFGAPLEPTVQVAKKMGLDFLATTDHSYDLDDSEHSYLQNDINLPKWKQLWQDAERINRTETNFRVIPGEELSAGNSLGENVHFIILNNQKFFYGSGDGAEKHLQNRPENSIKDVLSELEENAVSFAAHPEITPPVSQKIIINRGKWHQTDYRNNRLTGLEILNSEKDKAFYDGLNEWVNLLLDGYKLSIVAGNDAHGNFGRFRQLKTPFVSMVENDKELLARARTGILVDENFELENIIKALKHGKSIITDGPFCNMELFYANEIFSLGDTFPAEKALLKIKAKSSRLFGEFKQIKLIIGDGIAKKETQRYNFFAPLGSLNFTTKKFVADLPERGYVRMLVETQNSDKTFLCLTNPIFIDHSRKTEFS